MQSLFSHYHFLVCLPMICVMFVCFRSLYYALPVKYYVCDVVPVDFISHSSLIIAVFVCFSFCLQWFAFSVWVYRVCNYQFFVFHVSFELLLYWISSVVLLTLLYVYCFRFHRLICVLVLFSSHSVTNSFFSSSLYKTSAVVWSAFIRHSSS